MHAHDRHRYDRIQVLRKEWGRGGIWFLGFIGALVYYIHYHSGTFWLVVLAFLKSLVWPAFVVYHVLQLH